MNGSGQNFPGRPSTRPPAQRSATMPESQQQSSAASSLMAGLFGGIANIIQTPGPQNIQQQAYQEDEEFLEKYHPSLKYLSKFEDKSVLVTGATGAVGSAVAKKLIKQNCRMIVLFVRDLDNLDEKIKAAMDEGRVKLEQIDLREPQRIEQKFSHAIKTYFKGEVDHIIMCHGVVVEKGVITCTIPKYDQTMLVNVRSMMHLVSLAVPFLKKTSAEKGQASITILTSAQGTKPDPKSPVMSTAAAMVQMLIKVTALETAFFGVRVNGVATGVINSQARMKQDLMAMALKEEENTHYLKESARDVPLLERLNNPKEVAESLLFLASDDASFITGEILTMDGGQSLTTDAYDDYAAELKSAYAD